MNQVLGSEGSWVRFDRVLGSEVVGFDLTKVLGSQRYLGTICSKYLVAEGSWVRFDLVLGSQKVDFFACGALQYSLKFINDNL